jgi:hypothetical protein
MIPVKSQIRLYSGQYICVSNLQVGDVLVTSNLEPFPVTKIQKYTAKIYTVIPQVGEPFYVTEDTVLTVSSNNTKFYDTTVCDLLSMNMKHHYLEYTSTANASVFNSALDQLRELTEPVDYEKKSTTEIIYEIKKNNLHRIIDLIGLIGYAYNLYYIDPKTDQLRKIRHLVTTNKSQVINVADNVSCSSATSSETSGSTTSTFSTVSTASTTSTISNVSTISSQEKILKYSEDLLDLFYCYCNCCLINPMTTPVTPIIDPNLSSQFNDLLLSPKSAVMYHSPKNGVFYIKIYDPNSVKIQFDIRYHSTGEAATVGIYRGVLANGVASSF